LIPDAAASTNIPPELELSVLTNPWRCPQPFKHICPWPEDWNLTDDQKSEATEFALGIRKLIYYLSGSIYFEYSDARSLQDKQMLKWRAIHVFICALYCHPIEKIPALLTIKNNTGGDSDSIIFISSTFSLGGDDLSTEFVEQICSETSLDTKRIVKILNPGNIHFCFVILDPSSCSVTVVDSLDLVFEEAIQESINFLLKWYFKLRDMCKLKKLVEPSAWRRIFVENIPTQTDGYSCGVYTAYNLWYFLSTGMFPSSSSWSESDIPQMRLYMAYKISKLLKEHCRPAADRPSSLTRKAGWEGIFNMEMIPSTICRSSIELSLGFRQSVAFSPQVHLLDNETLQGLPQVSNLAFIEDHVGVIQRLIANSCFNDGIGNFNHITQVRDDKNSFYRAVSYAILLSCLSEHVSPIQKIWRLLERPCVSKYECCFEKLDKLLRQDKLSMTDVIEKFNDDEDIDWAMIFLLKQLVATHILNSTGVNRERYITKASDPVTLARQKEKQFGKKKKGIKSDFNMLDYYVYNILLTNEYYVDDLILTALPNSISADIAVVTLSEDDQSLQCYQKDDRSVPSIFKILLFRNKDHYDVFHCEIGATGKGPVKNPVSPGQALPTSTEPPPQPIIPDASTREALPPIDAGAGSVC